MKKTLTLFLPLSLIAGSFEDLEKELFDDFQTHDEIQLQEVAQQPAPTQTAPVQTLRAPQKTQAKVHVEKRKLRFSLDGQMLYMKPYFSNVPYLQVNNLTNYLPGSTQLASSYIKSQTFDGDFGFRLGLAFQTNWVDTIVSSSWSRFHTQSAQKNYNISDFGTGGYGAPLAISYVWNSDLTEPFRNNAPQDLASLQSYTARAFGQSSLKLDLVDLMLKFPYMTKKRLTILPSCGVMAFFFNYAAAITREKNYAGLNATSVNPFNQNLVSLKQSLRAIGPSLNFQSSLDLGSCFMFDLLAQGSLVFGQLTTQNKAMKYQTAPMTSLNLESKTNLFKALVELRMGFAWQKDWNKVGFGVKAGYDMYFMPSLMQLISAQSSTLNRSDLVVQGLYAGAMLRF